MSEKSIFSHIIDREIPAEIFFENERLIVIRDIKPDAPTHLLAIPKHPYSSIHEAVEAGEKDLVWELFTKLTEIAGDLHLKESGYRIIINTGHDAHQTVPHLHVHLLGGELLHMADPVPEA